MLCPMVLITIASADDHGLVSDTVGLFTALLGFAVTPAAAVPQE